MKNFKLLILTVLIAFSSACKKDNSDSTVVGDAIIMVKKSGTNTVYALAFYAYAYSPLKSVEVQSKLDPTNEVTLAANGLYTTNFIKDPADADFTTEKPAPDTYTFNAVFESGSTYQTEDVTTSEILAPPAIENCTYNVDKSYLELSWAPLTNADSYVFIVFDNSMNTVFRSIEFASTISTSSHLSASASGWLTGYPVTGESYIVRVFAYKYENSSSPNSYHIQSVSYSDAPAIIWGQAK